MDRFCRGCLVHYDEPTELLHYTEKNRRLFVYSTGLQVKRNDMFTFQLCKDCYLKMKMACNFKKQCRNSDKRFKSYAALKETGEATDLCTFLKNNDDSWAFRFPALNGSSTPAHQRIKDDDNESTTTSIRNFMTDIMPDADLPDTEARIIREVIEEEADLLDDSLDSHWMQDDASIDSDFKLDFSFSPFATPRSVNNDRYTPKKLSENRLNTNIQEHEQNCVPAEKVLDMPIITEESNHALLPIKVERVFDEQIDSLDAVNDIIRFESEDGKDEAPHCTIDRNLQEALQNTENQEFLLDELLVSPRVIPGVKTPPTPLINNILFGEKLDMDENSNSSHKYITGQCIESFENVASDVEMTEKFINDIDIKIEEYKLDEDKTDVEENTDEHMITGIKNQFNISNFYCKMCKRTFKSLRGLKRHSAAYHEKKPRPISVWICDHCGTKCNHRTNFVRHIRSHSREPPKKMECEECKLVFSSEYTLRMHRRAHAGQQRASSPERKRFVCIECGATTDKASNFSVHMKRHQKKYTAFCPECNKGFYRRAELTIHMRYHTGEKPFACTFCDMRFVRQDGLTRHIKSHLDHQMSSPKKRGLWTEENLKSAIVAVQTKHLTQRAAAEKYHIPRRTLRNHLISGVKAKVIGRQTTLNKYQEHELCQRIKRFAEIGLPLTPRYIRKQAFQFCLRYDIPNNFNRKKGMAGPDWLRLFLKRNPSISQRKPQSMNPASAQKLYKPIVQHHFQVVRGLYDELDILDHPERLYNEKGCRITVHHQNTVSAAKGNKRVHLVAPEHAENVTVAMCVNATGTTIPPMIVFKDQRNNPELAENLPAGTLVRMAKKGSMTLDLFVEFIQHLGRHKVPGKCLLIFDGAKSHMSYEAVQEAEKHNIVLYCLPSNTPHELQPLDNSINKSFDHHWDEEVLRILYQKPDTRLTKATFNKMFTNTWTKCMTHTNIVHGFKATGLFPFNPEAIPEEAYALSVLTESPFRPDEESENFPLCQNQLSSDQNQTSQQTDKTSKTLSRSNLISASSLRQSIKFASVSYHPSLVDYSSSSTDVSEDETDKIIHLPEIASETENCVSPSILN